MAGEIDFNGFRIDVYDKSTKKVLTDCVVIATYNGVNYSVPYVQSVGRYQLEVSSVPSEVNYPFTITRDGYTDYSASANTHTVAQAYISPKIPVLQQCDEILASKAAIKAAIQEMGVSCDDTLAEYANRIKAIPSPKIQEDRFEEITVYDVTSITITPDAGYDAMTGVELAINVNYVNVVNKKFKSVSIAKGVTFSVPLNTLNQVDLVIINGYADLSDNASLRIVAKIPISDDIRPNVNFILGEVMGEGEPYSKMWLCKYQYNETEKALTVTVLQEITITQ